MLNWGKKRNIEIILENELHRRAHNLISKSTCFNRKPRKLKTLTPRLEQRRMAVEPCLHKQELS